MECCVSGDKKWLAANKVSRAAFEKCSPPHKPLNSKLCGGKALLRRVLTKSLIRCLFFNDLAQLKPVQKGRSVLVGGTVCFRQKDTILQREGTKMYLSFLIIGKYKLHLVEERVTI